MEQVFSGVNYHSKQSMTHNKISSKIEALEIRNWSCSTSCFPQLSSVLLPWASGEGMAVSFALVCGISCDNVTILHHLRWKQFTVQRTIRACSPPYNQSSKQTVKMRRASQSLRRGGVRLRSIGSDQADLQMVISQVKEVRDHCFRHYWVNTFESSV